MRVATIVAFVTVFVLLSKKGTSNQIRNKFLKRTFLIGLLVIVDLTIDIILDYDSDLFSNGVINSSYERRQIGRISVKAIVVNSIAFVMMSEPLVYKTLINELGKYKLFGLCFKKELPLPSQDIISMLQASKNVEYVYLMLVGSSSFMVNYDQQMSQSVKLQKKDGQTHIEFKNVEIKNIEKWDIRNSDLVETPEETVNDSEHTAPEFGCQEAPFEQSDFRTSIKIKDIDFELRDSSRK